MRQSENFSLAAQLEDDYHLRRAMQCDAAPGMRLDAANWNVCQNPLCHLFQSLNCRLLPDFVASFPARGVDGVTPQQAIRTPNCIWIEPGWRTTLSGFWLITLEEN